MGHGTQDIRGGGGEELARRETNPGAALSDDHRLAIASVLPHVLVVSRRTVRKNKFVDFVGTWLSTLLESLGFSFL